MLVANRCVVGRWLDRLDVDDRKAFKRACVDRGRAELFAVVCLAEGSKPFSLTALKDHLNARCICD